ncbi:protein phosphatase CheZ [Denitromonas ohlonensis]|uniref:Protein phosphatase CheZ n=2 Tax=Denitromonas TaxID=139331 RepID=A0A557RV98_9RHOO|nr:protein phosphatase CheZ [Denitromonas ohlonensis]TVO69080.1 protein phosphatase CheZ [Denitromonas ohlonensis]TVO77180.1 protein phosphatase CheZ [Denitromonas ohlonensis]TVT78196.1 MAG: protein phosphatase CheZ [Denitromonas halophila]
MSKKLKFDETGDSDDLQALFDSIAAVPEKPKLEVISQAVVDDGSDSDDLQALFDAVAEDFAAAPEAAPEPEPEPPLQTAPASAAAPMSGVPGDDHSCEVVYKRLGQMTRKVHDSLRELGYDQHLQSAAEAMPDARERLNYIAQMTEQAASKVLNATDIAKPMQDRIESGAIGLKTQWDKLFANQLSPDEFKALAAQTRDFLGKTVDDSRATNAQLTEIMMAQDFQDLTGQVIKKVVAMAQQLEKQLLDVLIETAPNDKKPVRKEDGLMNGPVISAEGRDDVVSSQEQVDDLLESLGF